MSSFISCAVSLCGQVAILFVLMGVGFVCTKTKMVDNKGVPNFVNLLLYVVTPCLIVNSFLSVEFNSKTIKELGIAAGCAVISHLIGILISLFIKDKDEAKKSVYRFGTIFSNAGYMGLPLAQALFGDKGVFYASAYVIVFNIVQWTYGITLYNSGNNSKIKSILNPGTIGVIIGLPLFLLHVSMPAIIATPLDYIASLNTPLAMIVTGYYLACSNLKEGLKDAKMWLVIILRMVAVPLIALVLFKYIFALHSTLLCCCILSAAAPTAVNTMVLASKFGANTDLGLRLVTLTTLASIITMPMLLALAQI